jgi:hypothetical protein
MSAYCLYTRKLTLDQHIGVRIPGGQPNLFSDFPALPLSWLVGPGLRSGEMARRTEGSDTSGLEVSPAAPGSTSWNPTHEYLLVQQGVHIAEFHYIDDLARDKVYEFCYVAGTNKIRGAAAGFAMRPIAIR